MYRERITDMFYYGLALLIIPMMLYLLVLVIVDDGQREIKGCGSGCRGDCKMSKNAKRMRDLDIIFVKMEGCGHCKRLQELLERNNVSNQVTIIDSESSNVNVLRAKYGEINGFPTLISLKTGKKIIGGRGSIEAIIEELL